MNQRKFYHTVTTHEFQDNDPEYRAELTREIMEWFIDNDINPYTKITTCFDWDTMRSLHLSCDFRNEEDAIHFKLRFG